MVATLALVALLAGCGGTDASSSKTTVKPTKMAKPKPKTTTVHGTLTLQVGDAANIDNINCRGMDGYDDISSGASVSITDASNKTIGIGTLSGGAVTMQSGKDLMDHCTFEWSIDDVPLKSKFYEIHIANRDGPKFTRAQIQEEVGLSLGG